MPSLQALLKKAHTTVVFHSEKERAYLFLSEDDRNMRQNNTGTHTVLINGSEASICEALNGSASIRQLQAMNQLVIKGSYRQVLIIEALLLLSKNRNTSNNF